eukprot:scaffold6811_cov55-Phaeocystis_antarctica.AAC.5
MLPSIVRRVDRGHVLLSDGWFSAPVHPPYPLASQLAAQPPRRPGQTGRQRRRGQRRQHHLLASGRGAPRHRLAYPCTSDSPDSPASPPLHRLPSALPRAHPPASRPPRPRSHASNGGAPRSAGARL